MTDYLTPEQREPKRLWQGVTYEVDAGRLRASHAEADRVMGLLADALREIRSDANAIVAGGKPMALAPGIANTARRALAKYDRLTGGEA